MTSDADGKGDVRPGEAAAGSGDAGPVAADSPVVRARPDPGRDSRPHISLDTWARAAEWLSQGRTIAVATVIDTWGSAPVPVGGQMVVADDETFAGSVSGGCVEAEVVVAALEAIGSGRHQLVAFGVDDETAWTVGLPCGGRIEVLVCPLAGSEAQAEVARIQEAVAGRRPVLVETDLSTGARRLYNDTAEAPAAFRERLRSGRSGRVRADDAPELFLQVIRPAGRVIIVGATHIAQAIVALCGIVGLEPVVVDPRESFGSPERFGPLPVLNAWPGETLERLAPDAFTAVAVVAHVARIDDEALMAALASEARYVGALGSRRNHAKRCERLLAAGVAQEDIARIRSPIGLDIGAVTPEEIALAIVAEIVLALRGRKSS